MRTAGSRLVALTLAASAVLAACQDPQPSATSQSTPPSASAPASPQGTEPVAPTDASTAQAGAPATCDLLTPAEVEAVLGAPVAEAPSEGACQWAGGGGGASVALAVDRASAQQCEAGRPEGGAEVGGLGVDAWWGFVLAEVGVGTLVACPEGYRVTLTLTGGTDEATLRASAEALAAAVLPKI